MLFVVVQWGLVRNRAVLYGARALRGCRVICTVIQVGGPMLFVVVQWGLVRNGAVLYGARALRGCRAVFGEGTAATPEPAGDPESSGDAAG
jgi:hypothetical protein